jgi:hypothetical protein
MIKPVIINRKSINIRELITLQRISKKICMFSKNTGYLFRKKLKHDNSYYKQALVVARYQILIVCYSAMFRNEI